jgi:hypothetical protein
MVSRRILTADFSAFYQELLSSAKNFQFDAGGLDFYLALSILLLSAESACFPLELLLFM